MPDSPIDTGPGIGTEPPHSHPTGDTGRGTEVTTARRYALRAGYLVLGGGLMAFKLPAIISHDSSWSLAEGVVNSMLVALAILGLLGVRYPLQLLPILLFESAWKLIWLGTVALPRWIDHQLDAATTKTAQECLWVVIILAVIPWRYAVAHYLTRPGDPWRRQGPTTRGAGR